MKSILIVCGLLCHLYCIGQITPPDLTLSSLNLKSGFGSAVANVGDVNGDGWEDILIGAPYFSEDQLKAGAAYVYFGNGQGFSPIAWTTFGTGVYHLFGQSVCALGDINNDGLSDFAVSAWRFKNQKDQTIGKVYIYYGNSDNISTQPDMEISGSVDNSGFGLRMIGNIDFNRDGYTDLVVSAPNVGSNRGQVYLYYGSQNGLNTSTPTILKGEYILNWFGNSIACGDLNNDGFTDLAVGAFGYDADTTSNEAKMHGATYVYYGSKNGLSEDYNWKHTGELSMEKRAQVAIVNDLNNNNCDELLISTNRIVGVQKHPSRTIVFLGHKKGLSSTPYLVSNTPHNGGNAFFGIGDYNHDGFNDFLMTSNPRGQNIPKDAGIATCIFGAKKPNLNKGPYFQGTPYQRLGHAVAIGDINRDGKLDIIMGAPSNTEGSTTVKGSVQIFYGK